MATPRCAGAAAAALLVLLLVVAPRATDAGHCEEVVGELGASNPTSLTSLQRCLDSSGASFLLPVPVPPPQHTFAAGGDEAGGQVLDLGYRGAVLRLAAGASVLVQGALLRGVRLAPPSAATAFVLQAVDALPGAALRLVDVQLQTDCQTLLAYVQWVQQAAPPGLAVAPSGDVAVNAWSLGAAWNLSLSSVTLTCTRPAVLSQQGGRVVLSVTSDNDLYNALALAHTYSEALVQLALAAPSVALSSSLWALQGVTVRRNVTIGALPGTLPVLDLQDHVAVVHLAPGVFVTLQQLTLTNLALVNGYAPIPFTGLGLVSSFLWAFEYPRSLSNRTTEQVVAADSILVIYAEELSHMVGWANFVTITAGPLAAAAAPFRIGIRSVQVASTNAPGLDFFSLVAYGINFRNVTLAAPETVQPPVPALTARPPTAPLYDLGLPASTTAIGIWSQQDLLLALQGVQSLPACSPYSDTTAHLHFFGNASLDPAAWPSLGFNVSCNVTLAGTPKPSAAYQRAFLNLNLLPTLVRVQGNASLYIRTLTLVNMASRQGTYNLSDLQQTTAPLWFVERSAGGSASITAPLRLAGTSLVLPSEEFASLAAVVAGGQFAANGSTTLAFNTSIMTSQVASTGAAWLTLAAFEGLSGINGLNVNFTTFTPDMPYTLALPIDVYGPGAQAPPPPATSNTSSQQTLTIALAVALPLAAVLLAAAALAFILRRRRRQRAAATAAAGGKQGFFGPAEPGGSGLPEGDAPSGSSQRSEEATKQGKQDCIIPADEGVLVLQSSGQGSDSLHVSGPQPLAPMMELQNLILDLASDIKDKHLSVLGPIGSGGFATVYKGTWRGIEVAVKVIEFQGRTVGDEKLQTRALTEAAICANIQHANIVTTFSFDIKPVTRGAGGTGAGDGHGEPQVAVPSAVLGLGTNGELVAKPAAAEGSVTGASDLSGPQVTRWRLYLIQEFCELGSLRVVLESRLLMQADGQPNLTSILRIALDIVRGLQHLHKKHIIHGDLTPGNVLLRWAASASGKPAGGPPKLLAKLGDFGLSVKMKESQTSVDNTRTGTPFYASPEVRHHGSLTKASDVYALGVILWEMFEGRPCYQRVRGAKNYTYAAGFPTFAPLCPALYCHVATACMRKAPSERPTLVEVQQALQGLLDQMTTSEPGSSFMSGSDGPYDSGSPTNTEAAMDGRGSSQPGPQQPAGGQVVDECDAPQQPQPVAAAAAIVPDGVCSTAGDDGKLIDAQEPHHLQQQQQQQHVRSGGVSATLHEPVSAPQTTKEEFRTALVAEVASRPFLTAGD